MNKVAVTRPVGLGEDTTRLVIRMGWNPLIVHTVELISRQESEIFTELSQILTEGPVDWLVLMSPKGANLLFNILKSHSSLLPSALGDLRILAVGPKTREALAKLGILGVHIPNNFSSSGVADFLCTEGVEGKRVVLARSLAADRSLTRELTRMGASVETVNLYDAVIPSDLRSFRLFQEGIKRDEIQAILFTSALSASNLFLMSEKSGGLDNLLPLLRRLRTGAIGPVTARKLTELGLPPKTMPARFIIDDALRELLAKPFS